MKFDDLPREKQEAIMMIGHRTEIEIEDDKRRQSTRLGYRFGGTQGMVITMFVMVIITGFYMVGLAVIAPSLDIRMSTSPLLWYGFLPLALIPLMPFVFLKLRYALKALAIVATVIVVLGVLVVAADWVMQRIVASLV